MTKRKGILLGAIGLALVAAVWIAVVVAIGCYYFVPTEILDSEHVGVITMGRNEVLGLSVGTTRESTPGEIVARGRSAGQDLRAAC
jgi:hypothetical protein